MLIAGLPPSDVERAAREANVRVAWSSAFRFTLRTNQGPDGPYWGRRGWVIRKDGKRSRIPGAVCWHGHREFMREVFKINPEAVIKTAFATYKGSEHFEQTHENTRHGRNWQEKEGFSAQHPPYAELCDCAEKGIE